MVRLAHGVLGTWSRPERSPPGCYNLSVDRTDNPHRVTSGSDAPADAVTVLFRRHYHAVRSYATSLVDSGDVDDVVAETFTVAVRRPTEIPDNNERPWLLAITRRQASTHRRNERRRRRLTNDLASIRPPATTPIDPQRLSIEERHTLADALGTIDDSDRDTLFLSAWHGLRGADLAVALGTTTNAATVRLHRARQRFATAHRHASEERAAP